MKFPSVKILAESAGNTIKRFPFEVLFALAGTIASTINANSDVYYGTQHNWCTRIMMMANLGLLLSLAATLLVESKSYPAKKGWLVRVLAAVFALSLLFMINPDERQFDYARFFLFSLGFHLLVSFAAFTPGGHVQGFWQFNKTIFLRFLAGMLYSVVLYLGLFAAINATRFLFNLTIDNDIYVTLFVWIAGIFNTLFFLAGVPHDMEQLDGDLTYPKALKVFTQYVLIPLATVYVIILLAYEVKIALEWSLPKGLVSSLVLGYAVFGILSILLVFPIRDHEENKWIKTYARSFYFLLIPLLALLLLAVLARVLPYGITEQRYFLLVLAGWLVFITAYFLLSRKQNIKLIPMSLCLVTLLSVYGPQSAQSVSKYSQRRILIQIFEKYGKYKDGKLLPLGKAAISVDDGKEALEKAEYLAGYDKMQALQGYVDKDLAAVSDSLRAQIKDKRYRYDYKLKANQKEWLKKYLGLDKFSGIKNIDYQTYSFNIENKSLLEVKDYDYVLKLGDNYNNAPDTMQLKNRGLTFVKSADINGIYKLQINNETVQVDLKPFASSLIKQNDKLKQYIKKSDYQSEYLLPENMLTITRQTATYTVFLRMEKLEFGTEDDHMKNFYNTTGYYMIKKK